MPAKGKHRRPRNSRITRGFAIASTGGAAIALPLTGSVASAATPAQAPAFTTEKVTSVVRAATAAAPVKYTVAKGDSLSSIAREHSLSGGWKKLYRDNKNAIGEDPSLIRPGLRLTVGSPAPSLGKTAAVAVPQAPQAPQYADNLDGWIRESLAVMAERGIPGSYEGIHRNIMRESSGNRFAVNNWDSNALAGTPSKGLLQVIDPTFQAYHVPGTSMDPFDPVANITAACNYAAARYGSIDNVFGAY
ncbi:LysM peptidoglycan-binding domain-containing protein [Streptomyces coeruleoprunus]|uniref:LysM peptidoglycan-binding domain-containing protein n=1 Tax=Streptomyces coeruleoprunus TaxID=285563 RepID=A0ABV9X8K4_9ACTN